MFKSSGFKDIGIRKFEFVAKTQFLYLIFVFLNFNKNHKTIYKDVYIYTYIKSFKHMLKFRFPIKSLKHDTMSKYC